ncbi:uncharacterized protein [Musca autumnalis]|uniref:uncharacterized protein n=1 Tax=Musca autumnalis TaxID=221902 RepID=UPI003CE82A99
MSIVNSDGSSTYMENFCRAIHPDFNLGPNCVRWFRNATNHCTNMMRDIKEPRFYLWNKLMNFIFPEINTELMSKQVPIPLHPQRLSVEDCKELFMDIVDDYVLRAPRFAAESKTIGMLWQLLYSLLGIMLMGTLVLFLRYLNGKYGSRRKMSKQQDFLEPAKRLKATAKRSLNLAKTELRKIRVIPLVQPEELMAADGSPVIALKIKSKHELVRSTMVGRMEGECRLFRFIKHDDKILAEYKTENIAKALEFVGNDTRKLRLLIIFDDAAAFGEKEVVDKPYADELKCNSPQKKKRSKIPNKMNSPRPIQAKTSLSSTKTSGVENLNKNSPRSSSFSKRKAAESGSPRLGSRRVA